METLEVIPGLTVELSTPGCDLKEENCTATATICIRVHGCVIKFACFPCAHHYGEIIRRNYSQFATMKCAACGVKFTSAQFYELIEL